jgi:ABC-2 type transport system permease protein
LDIYIQELKMYARSTAAWSVADAAMLLVFLSLFPGFSGQAALLNEAMSKFPPQLLLAFGLSDVDLSSMLGFYGFVFLFIQMCLAIQSSSYGFSLVSVEEREWTADFLLAKPVRRSDVLTYKILGALTGLTITNVVIWIFSFVSIGLFCGGKPYSVQSLVLLLLSIVVFQLFFLSVGLVISLLVRRIRSVISYAMGLGFGMYMLSVFGDLVGENVLEKLTPFKQLDANQILVSGAYDLPLLMLAISIIVVSISCSYLLYNRRDIPAVV